MEGYLTTASFSLARDVGEGDFVGDLTTGVRNHGPGQGGDLLGSETRFCREQYHHPVSLWMTVGFDILQKEGLLLGAENLGLLTE